MLRKAISLFLSFSFLFTQPVFSQGAAQLNIGSYLSQAGSVLVADKFRPLHMRYFSYDIEKDNFQLLLDKGDNKDIKEDELQEKTNVLMDYFKIGLSLPNEKFWVNLRPDAQDRIIDPELEKTDMGRIMLAADLQLKKDTSGMTSPQTPEGKAYWDKLYKKAGELFGSENITIPTITRPWIVPGEIILREGEGSAYIFKANMKVMLEHDYLNSQVSTPNNKPLSSNYNFSDPRMKELNEYSTQLIRELIIPKLTKEVNTSKRYAALRQVFFSLVMARWFKDTFTGKPGTYARLIDSHNLNSLTSKEDWSKTYYFNEYKKSFEKGEYNLKEQAATPTGQVIRSYVSGGADMMGTSQASSQMVINYFKNMIKNRILLPVALVAGLGLVAPSLNSPDVNAADYLLNNHMQISPEEVEELNQTKIEEGIIRQGWTRDFIEAFVAIVGPSLKFDKVGIGIYSIPIDGGIIRIGVENDRCVVTIELRNGNAYSLEYGRIKGKKEALSLNGSPSGVDPETKIREIGMALNSLQEWPDFTIKWVSSLLVKRGIDHDLIDKFLNRTGDRYREPSVPGQDPNTISYKIPVYNQSLPGISYMEIDASGEEYVITIYLGDKNHFEATISLDGNVRVDTANVDFRRRGPGFTGNLVETIYQSLSGGGKSSAPITQKEEGVRKMTEFVKGLEQFPVKELEGGKASSSINSRSLPDKIREWIGNGVSGKLKPSYFEKDAGDYRGGFLVNVADILDILEQNWMDNKLLGGTEERDARLLKGRFLFAVNKLLPGYEDERNDKSYLMSTGSLFEEETLLYIDTNGNIQGIAIFDFSKKDIAELKHIRVKGDNFERDKKRLPFLCEVFLRKAHQEGKEQIVVKVDSDLSLGDDLMMSVGYILRWFGDTAEQLVAVEHKIEDVDGYIKHSLPVKASWKMLFDPWERKSSFINSKGRASLNDDNTSMSSATGSFKISTLDVPALTELANMTLRSVALSYKLGPNKGKVSIELFKQKQKDIFEGMKEIADTEEFGMEAIKKSAPEIYANKGFLSAICGGDGQSLEVLSKIALGYFKSLGQEGINKLVMSSIKYSGEGGISLQVTIGPYISQSMGEYFEKAVKALGEKEQSSAPITPMDMNEEFKKIGEVFRVKMEGMQRKYQHSSKSIRRLIGGKVDFVGDGMDALTFVGVHLSLELAKEYSLKVWQKDIRRYIELVERTIMHYRILAFTKESHLLKISNPGNKKINDEELNIIQECLDTANALAAGLGDLDNRISKALGSDKEKAAFPISVGLLIKEFGIIDNIFREGMDEIRQKYPVFYYSLRNSTSNVKGAIGVVDLLNKGASLLSLTEDEDFQLYAWHDEIIKFNAMVKNAATYLQGLISSKKLPGALFAPGMRKITDDELAVIKACLVKVKYLSVSLEYLDVRIKEAIDNDKEKATSGMGKVVGAPEDAGGIDFRAMNYLVQPMGSFKDLQFGLPTLNSSALERIDLDEELKKLRDMVKNGIVPSGMRVKEYLAACFQKGKIEEKQDDLLVCLAEIYRLAEEENLETSPQLRESLVIVDTGKFVLLPNNQKVGLN